MYVYNFCSAILNFEGANGSTTITDSARFPNTYTAYGNAQISTADFKIGASSLLLDGTGDYVIQTTTTQGPFWAGPGSHRGLVLEGYVRLKAAPGSTVCLFSIWKPTSNNRFVWVGIDSARQLIMKGSSNGTAETTYSTGATLPLDTWAHVRLRVAGASGARSMYLYLDNVLVYVGAIGTLFWPSTPANRPLSIGCHGDAGDVVSQCYFDSVILTDSPLLLDAPTTVAITSGTHPITATRGTELSNYLALPLPHRATIPVSFVNSNKLYLSPMYNFDMLVAPTLPPVTPATSTLTGTVTELGIPKDRVVRAYRRDTGALVSETVSNAVTGAYTITVIPGIEHNLVCLDDTAGTVQNDLIKRKTAP